MSARVALVTMAGDVGEIDLDTPAVADALRALGVQTQIIAWDDDRADWHAHDLVVMRSTWDYPARLDDFLAWTRRIPHLRNPAGVVSWNSDKRYLSDLGVPIAPTLFVAPGEALALPDRGDYVVKPVVSGGARDTARYTQDERAAAELHVAALHAAGRTAMVQPYLARIADGERALVYLRGRFSHAIRKGPVLLTTGGVDPDRVPHPTPEPYAPTSAELQIAEAALAAAPGTDLLYARVDLVLGDDGEPVVLELELIEPYLFLRWAPDGPASLAAAIRAEL